MAYSRIVDCTQEVSESIPLWPGNACPLRKSYATYSERGYSAESYTMVGGTGTHIDSPGHFFENKRLIHDLLPEELVIPGVLIDLESQCEANPDYELSVEDLLTWEEKYGRIPAKALVCMRTGWGKKFKDVKAYQNFNTDEPHTVYSGGTMHFPGFSKEAAVFLVNERNISAIGIDTLSLDKGSSINFEVHCVILAADKYQVENMLLEGLPENGITFVACPLKVKNAPEMSARVLALIN